MPESAVALSPLVEAAGLLRRFHAPGCVHADAVAVLVFRLETADRNDKRALRAAATVLANPPAEACAEAA